jgi:hypothetical protein
VLDAAGERGYDFIVIEAAEVDVLRPAMPNAPEALIATWKPRSLGRGSLADQEQAPRRVRTARSSLVNMSVVTTGPCSALTA